MVDKITLISCASKKRNYKCKAEEMYIGPLFKKSLIYARKINSDKIFILSAKYGLLRLDEEIEPYDETLNKMNLAEKKKWAENVLHDLKNKTNIDKNEFIFLAGENYRKFLVPHIKNYKIPLKGLGIGRQLKFLKEKTK